MHISHVQGGLEAVKILLQNRADANAADHVGMTPMDIAVKVQNFAVRKLLENNGVELQPALEQKARESSWLLKALLASRPVMKCIY